MYWPNEPKDKTSSQLQVGGRKAFERLASQGAIAALDIYSYRSQRPDFSSQADFEVAAIAHIRRWQPDILFVQHVTGFGFTPQFWSNVQTATPRLTIVYHDPDPYDARVKKIDTDIRQVLAVADLSLVCGLGALHQAFSAHTLGLVRYSPHCFDNVRFGLGDPTTTPKTSSVAMIGNRGNRKTLKFLYVPGGSRRAQFAHLLSKLYGHEFALYGRGWEGLTSARGTISFHEQERAIQSARISVNWDHFDDIPYYFSDRLPISLAAGVPHVTTYHPGYEFLFPDCPGLYPCRTIPEAIDCIHWLLSRPDQELMQEGLAARQWVRENLEADEVFASALRLSVDAARRKAGQS